MIKLFKKRFFHKLDSIHLEYSKWEQDKDNGIWYSIGNVLNRKNQCLLKFKYIPTGFGAVIEFFGNQRFFISKLPDMDKADAFISDLYGGLHNGYSITNLINKYLS